VGNQLIARVLVLFVVLVVVLTMLLGMIPVGSR
jgi:hypothetical protein